MNREPLLPKSENGWSKDANSYRKALHDDLYPKNQAWNPPTGGVTSASVAAEYSSVGRLWAFSILIEGPTTASGGAYLDLPFSAGQYSVFSVAVGGVMKPAIVDKGSSRLYLPDWTGAARAVISGVVVS